MRVLVVKMSSLGDVVHALPGLTDAARALGRDVAFDWVVEEAFAAIPERHAAVDRVIPIAWRRWRGNLLRHRRALGDFATRLRERHYDVVVDAQGLLKSAAVTALARGRIKAGPSRRSAREGAAALFYGRPVVVPKGDHAVDRQRRLFAGALEYPLPTGIPDYGLASSSAPGADQVEMARASAAVGASASAPRCVLLHGTTWDSKHWPERFWIDLARRAAAAGYDPVLPWGDPTERDRAGRIAAAAPVRVLPRKPLGELLDELAGAALVVGVDSGLAHLCAALAVPTAVLYGPTSSALTGCRGARVRNLQADFVCSPCLSRVCVYRGPAQTVSGLAVEPACFATLPPDEVWRVASELAR
jgi:heptosyltransferase-1